MRTNSQGSTSARAVAQRHKIVVLVFAATILFSWWFVASRAVDKEESHSQSGECVLLGAFLGSPELVANFERTPEEMQRWVDMYDRDCR